MSLEDLYLVAYPRDPGALYDRFGNRYVFETHWEFECFRRNQIISWITKDTPLLFL